MMGSGFLKSIHRYPVKGFPGQILTEAALAPSAGIRFDRFLAITNGTASVSQVWAPCSAFVRMTRNDGLPRFRISFDDDAATLRIDAPVGEHIALSLDKPASIEAANATLATWFPGSGNAPVLARRGNDLGYWDYEDAQISIINADTVAALSGKARQWLDPQRFRGNLLIAGLPAWGELAFVGAIIRIGTAELQVLRPIDRCKATSINPATGEADLNVPALLALQEGHMFCGVHARVVKPGRIAAGDGIEVIGRADFSDGMTNAAAPAVEKWPRMAEVIDRTQESPDTVSVWLRDRAGSLRSDPKPGQHIRLHLTLGTDAPGWRSFTVSGIRGDALRVTVKDEGCSGAASRYVHEMLHVGQQVLISGPFGTFCLDDGDDPIVLISGGIGITPMVAMVRHLAATGSDRAIAVLHSARNAAAQALWPEMTALAKRLPGLTLQLFQSGPGPLPDGVASGLIDDAAFTNLPLKTAQIYLCGPPGFMRIARDLALAGGARAGAIHSERFASPTVMRADVRPAPGPGPFQVRFDRAGLVAEWTSRSANLLDLAEAEGLDLPSNCRAGVCGACLQILAEGTVAHLTDPPFPLGPNEVLTCCAVPTSDITLAI